MKGEKQPYLSAWLNGGQDKNKRPIKGYTIVEVMIFLAVSGMMFIVAASFISGKQGKSEFHQGMNAINAQVQQVISDVSNGYYPHGSNFSCTAQTTGGQPNPVSVPPPGPEQGSNRQCVFLGKVMQFQMNTGTRVDPTAYSIFTVIGRQFEAGSNDTIPPSSFVTSSPVVAYNGINLTEDKNLEWGLEVTNMYDGRPANKIRAVGFYSSLGGVSTESGSQTVLAAAVPNSYTPITGQTDSVAATNIGNPLTVAAMASAMSANPKIVICFQSSSVSQYGALTIGDNSASGTTGQRLGTSIQISSSVISGC